MVHRARGVPPHPQPLAVVVPGGADQRPVLGEREPEPLLAGLATGELALKRVADGA